ncbi:MAG: hypothetical protein V1866_05180 [archaeon]
MDSYNRAKNANHNLGTTILLTRPGHNGTYRTNNMIEAKEPVFKSTPLSITLEEGICIILTGLGKDITYDPLKDDDKASIWNVNDSPFWSLKRFMKKKKSLPNVSIGGIAYIPPDSAVNKVIIFGSNNFTIDEMVRRLKAKGEEHDMKDTNYRMLAIVDPVYFQIRKNIVNLIRQDKMLRELVGEMDDKKAIEIAKNNPSIMALERTRKALKAHGITEYSEMAYPSPMKIRVLVEPAAKMRVQIETSDSPQKIYIPILPSQR